MNLQQTADGSLNRQHVIHEPLAHNERGTKELRRPALDVHRSVVTKPHHVGDTASITPVCLVRSRRQEPLCMPGLDADGSEGGVDESTV